MGDGDGDGDGDLHKIQISGAILASLLHRFSSSPTSIHGLLFGQLSVSTPPSTLSDNPSLPADYDNPNLLTATINSFISFPCHSPLLLPPVPVPPCSSSILLGWFSGRRNTPPRPSLFESTTTSSLSPERGRPSLFLLLTTPFQDQLIHTHEYKAYQYSTSNHSFRPKSLDIINVGPSFRSHYASFTPNSLFPLISCDLTASTCMIQDEDSKDQKDLDFYADGFDIVSFGRLMGSGAAHYTADLELLYAKMLAKLQALTTSVETSSAKVAQQENHNMKLRLKVAGLD